MTRSTSPPADRARPDHCADALAIVRRYGIELPQEVRSVLEIGRGESIKSGDARLARAGIRLIATPQMALEAAAKVALEAGITPLLLGDAIEGEAREVGRRWPVSRARSRSTTTR